MDILEKVMAEKLRNKDTQIRIVTFSAEEEKIASIQDIKEARYHLTKKGYLSRNICQMIARSLKEFPDGHIEISLK